MAKSVLIKRSSIVIDGAPKQPEASGMTYGELAVNFSNGHETIFIKNNNDEIVSFSSDEKIEGEITALTQTINEVSAVTTAQTSSITGILSDLDDKLTGVTINQRAATVSNGVASISVAELPTVTNTDDGKALKVINGAWTLVDAITVYTGTSTPANTLGSNGDLYLQTATMLREPDVVYETDGTTGLLGHNNNAIAGYWQLENLDLTPYRFVKCYFRASQTSSASTYAPSVVVTIPLDSAAMGPTAYIGSIMTPLPFNRNREYMVSCAVDSTKTKFQVIHQNTLWDTTTSDSNDDGKYCYKIEGWY